MIGFSSSFSFSFSFSTFLNPPSRSLSQDGDPCLRLVSHLSPRSLVGDPGLCRFVGGPWSLGRSSPRLRGSGEEGRLPELPKEWLCEEDAFDTMDCNVSVRPRPCPPERVDDPPLLLRLLKLKPRSRTAIASVPRYLWRSAKRLIGGSVGATVALCQLMYVQVRGTKGRTVGIYL